MKPIWSLLLLLQTQLFSLTHNDFHQVYYKIEQRLHPSLALLIVADNKKIHYIGGIKKEPFVSVNETKMNIFEQLAINYLFEPGKALFPLLTAHHQDNHFENFYSNKKIALYTKHLSSEELQSFFNHFRLNRATIYKDTIGKQPHIPSFAHNRTIQKQVVALGYGLSLTPMHMLQAYMQALKEHKNLQKFMLNNAKEYYNIFDNNIGLIGTIARRSTKGNYNNTFVLTYYGFMDKNNKRYFITLITQFCAPTNDVDSKNFISFILDIVDKLE